MDPQEVASVDNPFLGRVTCYNSTGHQVIRNHRECCTNDCVGVVIVAGALY